MSNYIIFGATSDIGRVLAEHVSANKNNRLMLVSRSRQGYFESILSDNVVEHNGYDLTDSSCIEPLRNKLNKFFDGSFYVITPTGLCPRRCSFEELSFDKAMEVIRSHYATVYSAALIVLPLLKDRGGGKLLTFSCSSVRYLYPQMATFTTGKAAVEALTQCIAHEYAKYNITANILRLSSVATDKEIALNPYGDTDHFMKVGKLANIICSLCESENTYLNGSVLELYEYSDSFYEKGYFERNKQR